MAKGKQSSGKHYVSKGSVGVNKSITKAVRRERSELDKMMQALKSWKQGSPTPRSIQKSFGVTATTAHRDWVKRGWAMKDKAPVDAG
tara:strand:- start:1185 stop:1445 length:261 start_codon:yes stop_codon:yes gene_type:complete